MNEPLSHDDVAQPARAPALREDAGLTDLASVARDIEIALRRARDYAAELAGALDAIAARASSAERSLRDAHWWRIALEEDDPPPLRIR